MRKSFLVMLMSVLPFSTAFATETLDSPASGTTTKINPIFQKIKEANSQEPMVLCAENTDSNECNVKIMISAGIHKSTSDNQNHFTLRFYGNSAPYHTCHIRTDGNAKNTTTYEKVAKCWKNGDKKTYDINLN